MSILNISIPYLTTSNLPNLIQGPNIPGSYAILLFIALNFTFTTRHIHNRSTFPLWPSLFILSGAISNCPPLFPSSILDTFWPWNSSSSVIYFFLFILFMRFSRKEYWSGLPCPPPGDLPDPGIEPESPALQANSSPLSHQGSPRRKC